MQWHAVAFVLSELCIRPSGPSYDRGWKAVESVFDKRILEPASKQKGMLWKPLRQLWTRANAVRDKRPKSTAWSDVAVAESPDFPRAFDPNAGISMPTNGNELGTRQFNLGVNHNTAEALGLDLNDYNDTAVDNDLNQPLPQVLDMPMNPEGSDVLPSDTDPMVQSWLANDTDLDLQTNNDFLRWSGWAPDFALSADPMAGFPIMNTNMNRNLATGSAQNGGAQEWL